MMAKEAPEWKTTEWLNTPEPLSLAALRGRVVLVHAFQMLCRGCVEYGIPQAKRVAELFAGTKLTVVGLHTVFEHHEKMGVDALRNFVREQRLTFPIGVDSPAEDGSVIPQTMAAYGMQGTPTTLLIDGRGQLRRHVFGRHHDLILGAELQALLMEAAELGEDATQG